MNTAASYRTGMDAAVIAHEVEHLILGHSMGVANYGYGHSRDKERQADSFAASIAKVIAYPFMDDLLNADSLFGIPGTVLPTGGFFVQISDPLVYDER